MNEAPRPVGTSRVRFGAMNADFRTIHRLADGPEVRAGGAP